MRNEGEGEFCVRGAGEERTKERMARASLEGPCIRVGPWFLSNIGPLITGYTEAKQTYTPLASLVERTHEEKCETKQRRRKRKNGQRKKERAETI